MYIPCIVRFHRIKSNSGMVTYAYPGCINRSYIMIFPIGWYEQ